jgi:hypothetical protein
MSSSGPRYKRSKLIINLFSQSVTILAQRGENTKEYTEANIHAVTTKYAKSGCGTQKMKIPTKGRDAGSKV